MSGQDAQLWMHKLSEAAKQDPRKTGALGVLLLVLGIMLVRTLMSGDAQPARASGMVVGAGTTSANARNTNGAIGATNSSANGVTTGNVLPAIDLNPAATPRANNSAKKLREWM